MLGVACLAVGLTEVSIIDKFKLLLFGLFSVVLTFSTTEGFVNPGTVFVASFLVLLGRRCWIFLL